MADGPFRNPKGRSFPHPKYCNPRWRIDIHSSHGISPIESSWENISTWHITRRHYYQIPAAKWQMIHLGTLRVGHIHTPNIVPIAEGLISIPTREPSYDNRGTWHIIQQHYYQIAEAQWRMVHFWTPAIGPIHTPNIGPIDWRLISIPAMESHPVKRIKAPDISYDGTTTK